MTWLAVTLVGKLLDFAVNVSLSFEPVIQFGLVALVACATNVFNHVACQVVKALVNYEIPNLNRPSFVVGRTVLGHGRTLGSRGCRGCF